MTMEWTANPCTGRKRPPGDDNDLQAEQPLSKKLAMLSIHLEKKHHSNLARAQLHKTAPVTTINTRAHQDDDSMEVDNDNPNVVFVHNLDDELLSDEDEDAKGIVFLPDIEKKLTRVPYDIARGSSGGGEMRQPQQAETSTALVLYTVPTSLTVSAEQDGVKRAIIEARERIRKKQAEEIRASMNRNSELIDSGVFGSERDPDAMDIE
ncbi:hypothetical protein DFP73DRAFT_373861 [Morchella snyderi]|nr:hypothetical protein DFP73DRAFT_373861 [Morchella snyderi]